ncbi:hypothetical protein LXJ15735_04790 [Lacrimispora xylanolytica]
MHTIEKLAMGKVFYDSMPVFLFQFDLGTSSYYNNGTGFLLSNKMGDNKHNSLKKM